MIEAVNGSNVTAFAAAWLLLAGCGQPTDAETAIREWVARGEAAVASEDRSELVAMVSPAYADARGNSRDDIDRMLRLVFLRQADIKVLTHIDSLKVYDETAAEVTLTTAFAGSQASRAGFSADAVRFEFELENDGSDWQLISARWAELGRDVR